MMLSPSNCIDSLQGHNGVGRTPVTAGTFLMVYLALLYFVAMLVMGRCLRRHKLEPTPRMEGGFALPEGQTILEVMDKTTTMCSCIGTTGNHVHDAEETIP
jgi:hypothetical protein